MENSAEGVKKRKRSLDGDDHKRPSSHQPSTPLQAAYPEESARPPPGSYASASFLHQPPGKPVPSNPDLGSSSHSFAPLFGQPNVSKDVSPSTNQKSEGGIIDIDRGMARLHLSDQDSDLIDFFEAPPVKAGGFGEIYIAVYRPTNLKLAMKRPRVDFPTDDMLRRFRREAATWAAFKHPNILPFFGTMNIRHRIYLVSPWMPLGDLLVFVQARIEFLEGGEGLPDESATHVFSKFSEAKTIQEIAAGLSYLHSIGVVHGDMKGKHVLLNHEGCAQICGFALTKILDRSATSTDMKGFGTLRWQSPELFEGYSKSFASDVYAFGMTISEVLAGNYPLPNRTGHEFLNGIMIRNERPAFQPLSRLGVDFEPLWKIAARCWERKPEDRPPMAEVQEEIRIVLSAPVSTSSQMLVDPADPTHLSHDVRFHGETLRSLEARVQALEVASPPVMDIHHPAWGWPATGAAVAETGVREAEQESANIGANSEQSGISSHTTSSRGPLDNSTTTLPYDIADKAYPKLMLTDQDIPLLDFPNAPPSASGSFGELYIAIYRPFKLKLAMKRSKVSFPTEGILQRFRNEAKIWSTLEHVNILPFYGTLQVDQQIYIASPWMSLGDLLGFVQKRDALIQEGRLSEDFSDASVPFVYSSFNETRIIREIASGLEYLHSVGVIHGDIKARNVLLNDAGCAQICDFGLTQTLSLTVSSTEPQGAGSLRWLSPELFNNLPRSEKSDVYAFGMTVVEVLTGNYPFPHLNEKSAVVFATVIHNERPDFEPMSRLGVDFEPLWNLAAECWRTAPMTRPPLNAILQYLDLAVLGRLPDSPGEFSPGPESPLRFSSPHLAPPLPGEPSPEPDSPLPLPPLQLPPFLPLPYPIHPPCPQPPSPEPDLPLPLPPLQLPPFLPRPYPTHPLRPHSPSPEPESPLPLPPLRLPPFLPLPYPIHAPYP